MITLKVARRFGFVLALFSLPSCTTDLTNNPSRMTDYVVGAIYELKQPVFLWRGRLMPRHLADSEGMLPGGTRLAVRRVLVDRSPEMGTFTDVYAEILTGEHTSKMVSILLISEQSGQKGQTRRDPRMLSLVQEMPKAN